MRLRRARTHEAELLTDLSLRSKRSNGYDDAFMAACVEELTITPSDITDNEFWVAEDGQVCGCMCLCIDATGTSGEVHAFFVEPGRKRSGVGRRLAAKMLERARALGLRSLRLDADPKAVPFYESVGFTVAGSSPSGSIPGRFIPHMTMDLAARHA